MTEVVLQKHPTGCLIPADEKAERYLRRIKQGDGVVLNVSLRRNVSFHRRFFALLNLAFESWAPADVVDGEVQPVKSFDEFRRELLILAGHYDAVYRLDGSFTLVARSIAFDKLDDLAFEDVYRRVLTVVWEKVLRAMRYASPEAVDEVVQRIIRFE